MFALIAIEHDLFPTQRRKKRPSPFVVFGALCYERVVHIAPMICPAVYQRRFNIVPVSVDAN